MTGVAAAGDRDMRGGRFGCLGKAAAVGMTATAIFWRSLQNAALMTAFALGIVVRTGQWKAGFGMVECGGGR